MENQKKCSKCGVSKYLTSEYYSFEKRNKDGFRNSCKACQKIYREENKQRQIEYGIKYREDNKEKIKIKSEKYRENNREEIKERNRKWSQENKEQKKQYYEENKDWLNEQKKQYREENREWLLAGQRRHYQENKKTILEKSRIYGKGYYKQNKKKIAKYAKEYRRLNPQRGLMDVQKRRARKKDLPSGLTINQWKLIKKRFNNSCAYCGMREDDHIKKYGQKLQQEHFIPLIDGGEYTINNIIPACRSCNYSKNSKNFFQWYPETEQYDMQREDHILDFLGYSKNKIQQLSILL